jgi:hypothetical protein
MDAAAGVFILFQNSPFYTLWLGVQRLRETLATQREALTEFIATVEATGRYTTTVENLSPLVNARVALGELESVAAQRSSSFQDIEDSSAFQRFNANTQRFLDDSGKNVKSGGELVRTPEEARGLLASSYTSLKEEVEDIVRRVGLAESAITDFSSLDLPATLSSSIIANSKTTLDSRYDELNALTPKQRLGVLRDVVLDVLAARSTVRGFGNLTPPTTFLILDGEGQLFSDAAHEATPATILSETYGPYPILSNNELYFTAEDTDLTVAVQPSFVPFLEGTVYGPFNMYAGGDANGIPNNEFRVTLHNHFGCGSLQNIDVTFSTGGDPQVLEAWTVAEEFNLRVENLDPDLPIVMEPYANPVRFTDLVTMTFFAGVYTFTAVNPAQDFVALNVVNGDYIIITDPAAENYRAIYKVNSGGVAATTLNCTQVYHPAGSYSAESVDITITGGSEVLPVRLRTSDTRDVDKVPIGFGSGTYGQRPDHRLDALNDRMSIELPNEGFDTYVASLTGVEDLSFLGGYLPGAVAGLTMVVEIDSLAPQTVDLTGFVGITVSELITAIQAQLTDVVVIETNPGSSPSYIKFTYDGPSDSVSRKVSLVSGALLPVVFDSGGTPPYTDEGTTPTTMQFNATASLGFYAGSNAIARKTTAAEIANSINVAASSSWEGTRRVEAAAEFEGTLYSGRGRTDPNDWLKVICSKLYQRGVTASQISSNNYWFYTMGAESAGVLDALPPNTDILVVRASTDPADIGLMGVVSDVTDERIKVTFTQDLAGSLTDLDVEIGPLFYDDLVTRHDFSCTDFGAQAVITNSPANDGTYNVLSGGDFTAGEVPFELTVDAPMPYPQPGGALPNYYDLEVGHSKVRFTSLDVTTATYLFMDDDDGNVQSTYATFFPSDAFVEAVGTTPHFQLPEWPKNLERGDILELYYYENLFTHSSDHEHVVWTQTGGTLTPNAVAAPEGYGEYADEYLESGVSEGHRLAWNAFDTDQWAAISGGSDVRAYIALNLKYTGRQWVRFTAHNLPGFRNVWFDIQNGVVGSNTLNPSNNAVIGMDDLGDGWYRCWILMDWPGPWHQLVWSGASGDGSTSVYTGLGSSACYLNAAQFTRARSPANYTKTEVTDMARTTDPVIQPGYSSPILSLEEASTLVELTTEFPTDLQPQQFTRDTPYPFARVRKQSLNNYELMRALLETWLETDEAEPAYFTELLRLLNPLAVNLNPTAVEVNDAKTQLELLYNSLGTLDGYLAGYEATAVGQIDTLVSTLIEKGSDRAVDVLLEGQFSTFFGMDQDDLSYAGTVQKGIKEVMREDLPQRKDNRLGRFADEDVTIGEYEEPDFEYDFSDIDDVDEPDIPAGSTYG